QLSIKVADVGDQSRNFVERTLGNVVAPFQHFRRDFSCLEKFRRCRGTLSPAVVESGHGAQKLAEPIGLCRYLAVEATYDASGIAASNCDVARLLAKGFKQVLNPWPRQYYRIFHRQH